MLFVFMCKMVYTPTVFGQTSKSSVSQYATVLALEYAALRRAMGIYKRPVQLKNLGQTCFLNALIQCLASSPSLDRHNLWASRDNLDELVAQVLDEANRDHHGSARRSLELKTPLVKKLYGTPIGQQGPQDPCAFFIQACTREGLLSSMFCATVIETLKCDECRNTVRATQTFPENYVSMLYYDDCNTSPQTICDLFHHNIKSGVIAG